MKVTINTARAFALNGQGGNPAGVVLTTSPLSTHAMQAIAAKVGLSETAFVARQPSGPFEFQFYTPNRRIENCGHATLASFALLQQAGLLTASEHPILNDLGPSHVRVKAGRFFLHLRPQTHQTGVDPGPLLQSLGLTASVLDPALFVTRTSAGVPFFLIGVKPGTLPTLKPDFDRIEKLSQEAIGYYVFCAANDRWQARMFAPSYGIKEESATGMAAGALAHALHSQRGGAPLKIEVLQGQWMCPPSVALLQAEVSSSGIYVGGEAVVDGTLEVEI